MKMKMKMKEMKMEMKMEITIPERKIRKCSPEFAPMGRWVDGGSAGGRTPPFKVRTGWQMCTTCPPLQWDASASLPFPSSPFFWQPPSKTPKKHCHFALWALFEVPAPFRAQPLTAWCIGPFVHTSPNRSGLNDGGGPPSTHRGNLWKQLPKSFETVSTKNEK